MSDIQINGLEELVRKFNGLEKVTTFLQPAMQRAVFRVEAKIKPYPPAPPNSRYRRTGTLGRRWTTKVDRTASALTGRIGNNTEYAPQVQSAQFQRPIFKRIGWTTDQQAIDAVMPAITADFNATVQAELNK